MHSAALRALAPASVVAALALGCSDRSPASPTNDGGPQDEAGLGDDGGAGDDASVPPPCTGATDPRVVIAAQRVVHLSKLEVVNTIRALLGDAPATAILTDPSYSTISDETGFRIPLLSSVGETETINADPDSFPLLFSMAGALKDYVVAHFQDVTGCAAGDEGCALGFLDKLAAGAFRRPVAADEVQRIHAVYASSKSQIAEDWSVTSTVEEAAGNAVAAIFSAPQTLWLSEIGNPAAVSGPLPGVPLTDYELASTLAYFLTGAPPDAELLAAAASSTLHANLDAQTSRLLATPAARAWLTTIMFASIGLNRLYEARVDTTTFPEYLGTTPQDMYTEARMFLDDALWNGKLSDLLLSRNTFVNTNLATNIYGISPPADATDTAFGRATLPADQRSGLLTNAAFVTLRVRDVRESVVFRAQLVEETFLCTAPDGPPDSVRMAVATAGSLFKMQTAQEQVAYRRAIPICNGCHQTMDPFGLALDGYDNIGRVRTMVSIPDGRVVPVDPHTNLPPGLGGAPINGAIDLASAMAATDLFPQCMAKRVLDHAMDELSALVDFPATPVLTGSDMVVRGCAVQELAARFASGGGQTFTDLVRAAVASPAFYQRNPDPLGYASSIDDGGADDPAQADGGQPGDDGGDGASANAADAADNADADAAATAPAAPDVLKTLALKRTVLNYVLDEISRMQGTVPSGAQGTLEFHAEAARSVGSTIATSIHNFGYPP